MVLPHASTHLPWSLYENPGPVYVFLASRLASPYLLLLLHFLTVDWQNAYVRKTHLINESRLQSR